MVSRFRQSASGSPCGILRRMDETWKDIPGSDYSVSNMGRVASRRRGDWRVLKPVISANLGYPVVALCHKGKSTKTYVHRLVAEAFLGPPPTPKHEVNHIDGVRSNPRVDNLEWVTRSENGKHCYLVLGRIPTVIRGDAHANSKLAERDVIDIRLARKNGETLSRLAARYGVGITTISAAVRGQNWKWLK